MSERPEHELRQIDAAALTLERRLDRALRDRAEAAGPPTTTDSVEAELRALGVEP